jgi:hypothetical protein
MDAALARAIRAADDEAMDPGRALPALKLLLVQPGFYRFLVDLAALPDSYWAHWRGARADVAPVLPQPPDSFFLELALRALTLPPQRAQVLQPMLDVVKLTVPATDARVPYLAALVLYHAGTL